VNERNLKKKKKRNSQSSVVIPHKIPAFWRQREEDHKFEAILG
jgi:hypothetical protein